MVGAQHHGIINALNGGNAFGIDADSFVDHGDEDAVNNETGSFFDLYGGFADVFRDLLDGFYHLSGGIQAGDDFDQLHNRSGIEEMHADDGTIELSADFGDGEGGSIGGEHALGFADLGELLESLLLDLHILNGSLDDEVTILADLLGAGGDLGKDGIGSSLLHLALGHAAVQTLGDLVFAVSGKLFVDIAQENLVTIGLSKGLSDAGTHSTSANNTNFHFQLPP